MVETVAGMMVLVIVMGIFALFLMPFIRHGPDLRQKTIDVIQVGQLQQTCLKIGPQLNLPPWWTMECIEASDAAIRVKDIGFLYTTKEEARPDILSLTIQGKELQLVWQGQTWHFSFQLPPSMALDSAEDGRPLGIIFSLQTATDPYSVYLPFNQTVSP